MVTSAITSAPLENLGALSGMLSGNSGVKPAVSSKERLDDFLSMLTTQLKNQDPTNPMAAGQFMQQISALSGIEAQINTQDSVDSLNSLFSAAQMQRAVGYIGRQVEAEGNAGLLDHGAALFAYTLAKEASEVEVTVSDAAGKVVFSGKGDVKAGRNLMLWDGTNGFTGQEMPDGIYTLAVNAKDASGNVVEAVTHTIGRITSVDLQNGSPTLMMGKQAIPLEKVLSISEAILSGGQTG